MLKDKFVGFLAASSSLISARKMWNQPNSTDLARSPQARQRLEMK